MIGLPDSAGETVGGTVTISLHMPEVYEERQHSILLEFEDY